MKTRLAGEKFKPQRREERRTAERQPKLIGLIKLNELNEARRFKNLVTAYKKVRLLQCREGKTPVFLCALRVSAVHLILGFLVAALLRWVSAVAPCLSLACIPAARKLSTL